jgi:methyltransferase (TIGR00027 family)
VVGDSESRSESRSVSAESPVATTAFWIAAARARETARPDRLFEDRYAERLAGRRGVDALERSERVTGQGNAYLPVRTRYFDDRLVEWTDEHRDGQVVLLGAGLDTRAFRLPVPSDVTLFELDRAAVFAEKEPVLASMGARARCRRRVIPTDLEGSWRDDLEAAAFDPHRPTMWVAEGLLFYLSEDAVRALLRDTAALASRGSRFLADAFNVDEATGPTLEPYRRWLRERGRPMPFGVDDPVALFEACGWSSAHVTHPGAPDANFGRLAKAPGVAETAPTSPRAFFVSAER